AGAVHVQRVEVAVDELDRLEQAAGRFALPGLAEAAAAQGFDQAVAGDRLRVWLPNETHVRILPYSSGGSGGETATRRAPPRGLARPRRRPAPASREAASCAKPSAACSGRGTGYLNVGRNGAVVQSRGPPGEEMGGRCGFAPRRLP